ncbi:zinc-binding dehydrogenase [Pseudonocardia lutea]|uniref:Zinc-binding dehydrogenase n=1 Tax=Pseudonocardia lutea TaxID=2172015 RepID=A0ABW1I1A4_9PSEU
MSDRPTATPAMIAAGSGGIAQTTLLLREPGPGELTVRLDAAALCTTDLFSTDGLGLTPRPFVPGHAATGVVEEVGLGTGLRPGTRVVVVGSAQCGRCRACLRGSPGACDDIWDGMGRAVGTLADDPTVTVHADGGVGTWAQTMLYRESNVVAIKSDAPPSHLAMLGCGITSGLGAVLEVGRVRAGDTVAVLGCGHLGLWMIAGAVLAGAERIIAVEPRAERRTVAAELGATDVVDRIEDVVARILDLTGGRGVDVALEAVGSTAAMEQAFAVTRRGGTVVPTGMVPPDEPVRLPGLEFAIGSRRIASSQTGGGDIHRTVPHYAALLDKGVLRPELFVTSVRPLAEVEAGLAGVRDRTGITSVITMAEHATPIHARPTEEVAP